MAVKFFRRVREGGMRFLKFTVLVALLVLLLGSTVRADDLTVVLDPDPVLTSYVYTGSPISVSWQSCGTASGGSTTTSTGFPSAYSGDDGCFAVTNESGNTLNFVSLTITASSSVMSQSVTCDNLDTFLTEDNCASVTLNPDGTVTLDFEGGSGIPNFTTFFVGEIGVTDPTDNLPTTFSVPTHDPSTLMLLLAGMSMLAVAGIRRTA